MVHVIVIFFKCKLIHISTYMYTSKYVGKCMLSCICIHVYVCIHLKVCVPLAAKPRGRPHNRGTKHDPSHFEHVEPPKKRTKCSSCGRSGHNRAKSPNLVCFDTP